MRIAPNASDSSVPCPGRLSRPALKTRDIARAIGPLGLVGNSGKPDGTRDETREIKQKEGGGENTAGGSLSGGTIPRRLSKRTVHPIFRIDCACAR